MQERTRTGGVPPAASAGALPRGGRSLTRLQGPCHPRLLGCGGLPGTEGTRHQCARLALGPALHGAAGGHSLLPVQPSSLQATLGQSPHIHVFREKLGFGKGKGSEHPLHLHPAARRHGDGAGTGCGSWGQSSPRSTPGLLLLLLPRQRQYDLLKLFLFPSSSSSAVCVRKTNCLIIVLISNHVTFSVTLQAR